MIIAIGEILVDRFPGYSREGGAPFNFAFHLKRLGLPIRLITRIGQDARGQQLKQTLTRQGFDPSDIQVDAAHQTGVVKVTVDDAGTPRYEILEDVAYDHLHLAPPLIYQVKRKPALIYYGTLIQRNQNGFEQLGRLLKRRPVGTKCFCDINLRAPHYSRATIQQSLTHADILKLNDQELHEIRRLLGEPTASGTFVEYLFSIFNIEMLSITRGAQGSTLITPERTIQVPPAAAIDIRDTVGAGDGYAAMLAAGTFYGLALEKIAGLAGDFAARICQLPGAVPEKTDFYDVWKIRLGEPL